MKGFFKSKRGASQVVSSLMFILITLAAFSYVWNYANSFINAQRSELFPALKERFVVEDIWFHPNGTIILYLWNVGMVPLMIEEVHVDNLNAVINPPTLFLGRSEGGVLRVQYGAWISNQDYNFVIITERGYYVEVVSTAP